MLPGRVADELTALTVADVLRGTLPAVAAVVVVGSTTVKAVGSGPADVSSPRRATKATTPARAIKANAAPMANARQRRRSGLGVIGTNSVGGPASGGAAAGRTVVAAAAAVGGANAAGAGSTKRAPHVLQNASWSPT